MDGFIAVVGHTLVVGSSADHPVTGRKADVLQAGHIAGEVALRMLKPGGDSTVVADTVQKVAAEYGCVPIEGEHERGLGVGLGEEGGMRHGLGSVVVLASDSERLSERATVAFLHMCRLCTLSLLLYVPPVTSLPQPTLLCPPAPSSPTFFSPLLPSPLSPTLLFLPILSSFHSPHPVLSLPSVPSLSIRYNLAPPAER